MAQQSRDSIQEDEFHTPFWIRSVARWGAGVEVENTDVDSVNTSETNQTHENSFHVSKSLTVKQNHSLSCNQVNIQCLPSSGHDLHQDDHLVVERAGLGCMVTESVSPVHFDSIQQVVRNSFRHPSNQLNTHAIEKHASKEVCDIHDLYASDKSILRPNTDNQIEDGQLAESPVYNKVHLSFLRDTVNMSFDEKPV